MVWMSTTGRLRHFAMLSLDVTSKLRTIVTIREKRP